MIKNYISRFKNINPIYLIDFSISEDYVFNELEKRTTTEIVLNINYLIRTALYFRYEKLYEYLKQKAFDYYKKTGNEKKLLLLEKESEFLKKYAI